MCNHSIEKFAPVPGMQLDILNDLESHPRRRRAKSFRMMSGMILNRLKPQSVNKSVANEKRCLKAM